MSEMCEKAMWKRKIFEYDFAIHELVLFLDTHPDCKKAMALLCEYRDRRKEILVAYEQKYGTLVITPADVRPAERWQWIDGPWPWENNFMEE